MTEKRRPIHYDHPDVFGGLNLCNIRGTWHATSNPKKVTCKRCRRRLTYWVKRMIRAGSRRK